MEYIVFYNYASGHREFGYYSDYDEANRNMNEAIVYAKKYGSNVEIGIAEVVKCEMVKGLNEKVKSLNQD